MINASHLTFRFGDKTVFDDYSESLPDEGIVLLSGESGIGKTTFLRLLLGTLRPENGSITGMEGRKVSVAFQEPRLLGWKTVLENVASVSTKTIAMDLLSRLSMDSEYNTKCNDLSGGQKQRVSIARAFAFGNDIVLLDEPFSGLDDLNRKRVQDLILTARLAIIASHNDFDESSFQIAKRIELSNPSY
jgi:ABC-type nitrate/sulfonate/bicarbonate transport system, ATPase component